MYNEKIISVKNILNILSFLNLSYERQQRSNLFVFILSLFFHTLDF